MNFKYKVKRIEILYHGSLITDAGEFDCPKEAFDYIDSIKKDGEWVKYEIIVERVW